MFRTSRSTSIARFLPLAAAISVVLAVGSARAASFDCGKAASEREHLICADDKLSAQDTELGREYAAKRALLSPAGALLLQQSERAWFGYTQTVCGVRPHAAPNARGTTPTDCLKDAYSRRLAALAFVGRLGPFVFTRVDVYGARPVPQGSDSSGWASGFYATHTAYPQIDAPSGAAARDWNYVAENHGKAEERVDTGGNDDDNDYELGIVTERLVSTRWDYSFYPHGAAHGGWTERVWNAVLERPIRDLQPADLFGDDQDWSHHLGDIALKAIEENGWQPGDTGEEDEIREEATDPEKWFLRRDGLEVSFSSYSGGCYICTPRNGLVAWSKLRPIMTGTAFVP